MVIFKMWAQKRMVQSSNKIESYKLGSLYSICDFSTMVRTQVRYHRQLAQPEMLPQILFLEFNFSSFLS